MTAYESDFYTWTLEQAAAIRAGHYAQIDIENLAEEIESMGRSEKRALDSRLTVLLVHLLKWQFQPVRRGKSWQLTIKGQRLNVSDLLNDNPGLKPQLATIIAHAYQRAIIDASSETGIDETVFPANCPWSVDFVTDLAFYPD